jgi:glycosyltransferase involved in cell wall biosynthesis
MPINHKVLVFVKGLDLGGYSGGADLFGVNLACGLRENGVDVKLCVCYKFNTDAENDLINSLNIKGIIPIFLLEGFDRPRANGYIDAFFELNRYLNNHQIDIIHSHFHIGTLLSIMLKILRKVRWVVRTAHIDQEWKRGWRGFIKQSIIRMLIFVIFPLFVDLEAGVSRSTVEGLNNRFVAKLINKHAELIPNAISVPVDFALKINQKNYSGWQGDHPIIGSVGRLEEQKGYKYLINALPEVIQQYPNIETWIIGDGQLLLELKEQSEILCLGDHIVFWGKQNSIPELLSKMDVFVSSSIYEGLPTVVLEAMVHGVPCVVTDIPGTRDIAQEKNVVSVPARDSHGLACGINQVLENPSLRKILAENAIKSVNRFSIENISLEYIDAYLRL